MSDNQELQEQAQGIFNRAKAVIMQPSETWAAIAKETDEPMQVFLKYAVPLAAIGPIASFIGGQVFGYGAFGISYRPTFMGGLTSAILQYVLSLASIWLIAWVASFLSPKFNGKDDFAAAFRLSAYAMTAAWVVGLVGLIPALGILGLAGLYSLYLFYKGANPVMNVPQDKALPYTAVTVLIGIVVNFIASMIVASMMGPAAMAGMAGGNAGGDSATIDLGEYGTINVDGENQTIDMGEMGRIQIDGDTGEATINVDGEEVKIKVED